MNLLMTFIQKAIGQGVAILFGATGEIVTEKSGNLNLGIPGIMYMGGISGLMGAFFYENGKENPNGFVGLLIAFLATLICIRWADLQFPDDHTACKSECCWSGFNNVWSRFW